MEGSRRRNSAGVGQRQTAEVGWRHQVEIEIPRVAVKRGKLGVDDRIDGGFTVPDQGRELSRRPFEPDFIAGGDV